MTWGARDVTVRFGDRTALEQISIDLEEGTVACVVGGDGAGKTTLLRTLVGTVLPDAGEVRRPDDPQIGFMSASSGTYPDLSVEENLSFSAAAYGVPRAEIAGRVLEYVERTGLAEARDRLVEHLSGGMRQKLGVIRAMIHRPEVLVLDEPTTGVDPLSRADLWWLIARAAAEGAAIVVATTYLDEAERASRLLVLDEGRSLAQGAPLEIEADVRGEVVVSRARPDGPAAMRSWRRGTAWRVWRPTEASTGEPITPDLQDAITVASLARELETAGGGGGRS